MGINLPPNAFGVTIFGIILIIFECLSIIIAYALSSTIINYIHFGWWNSFVFWIVLISIVILMNMVFVNIDIS